MAGKAHWPYWPSLVLAVLAGTLAGTVVELAVIRRLFKAPRVIVLVATIGVAELARAVTLTLARLPHRLAADRVPDARSPASGTSAASRSRARSCSCSSWSRSSRSGSGGCSATPASAISVRASATERRPRPAHRHQPEARVDRDLDHRRLPLRGRRSSSTPRSRDRPSSCRSDPRRCCSGSRPRSSAGCVVPAGGRRRDRHRRPVPGARVQLPEHRRPRAVRRADPGALPRRPDEPRATTPARRASRSRRASRRCPSGCARSGGCGGCRSSSPAFALLVRDRAAARS